MSFPAPDKLAQNAAAPAGKQEDMKLEGLVMEPKLDGFRLLLYRGPNGVETYTRTGKSQKGKLPLLEAALMGLPEGTWLDGELVAFDDNGLPEWGKVQTVMGSNIVAHQARKSSILTYVVFDMMTYATVDIRQLPLTERRDAMKTALESSLPCRVSFDDRTYTLLDISAQVKAKHEYHDELVAQGYEGTIVKDPTKPYASGKRGHGWTKFKANDEMDVVIMGFKPGENSFTGMIGAIEFGQYKPCEHCNGTGIIGGFGSCPSSCQSGKVLAYRGRCSGMDMKKRQELTNDQAGFIGQVISLAYMGIMPSGSPRHPQYKRFRTDKPAEECIWT